MSGKDHQIVRKINGAGWALLVLGSALFVLLGFRYERLIHPWGLADFKEIYYASGSALHHHDPYDPSQLYAYWQMQTGNAAADAVIELRQVVSLLSNLPTSLFLIVPIAALPWNIAQMLWMMLTAAAFILAAVLTWRLAVPYTQLVPALLLFVLLATSQELLLLGNLLGVVVSLTTISVWCFLRERLQMVGVLCLGIALTLKPHDAGFVWLYFLLAGGAFRKRALQSLAVVAAIGIFTLVWIHNISPHWIQELQSNMHIAFAHGGRDDPGPAGRSPQVIICLQAVLSFIRDNPHFYNPASYLISGVFILFWALVTWRARVSPRTTCLALAAIAPLSMLPVYHRTGDATLLILAIPACAILWQERQPARWAVLLLTIITILSMNSLLFHFAFRIIHMTPGPGLEKALEIGHPLLLLVLGIFFLWVYFQQTLLRDPAPSLAERTPQLA